MKCKVDGCNRDCMYKEKQLCQKHYFRLMRNGNFDPKRVAKYRTSNPAGYQILHKPNHRLSDSRGKCYEHRFVIYEKYGETLPNCEICGKETNWDTCHIDHKDEDVTNNNIENLRPLCRGCNTGRTERACKHSYIFNGVSMTLKELSKLPNVEVSRHQIKHRLDSGMSLNDALFKKSITHKKTHN